MKNPMVLGEWMSLTCSLTEEKDTMVSLTKPRIRDIFQTFLFRGKTFKLTANSKRCYLLNYNSKSDDLFSLNAFKKLDLQAQLSAIYRTLGQSGRYLPVTQGAAQ